MADIIFTSYLPFMFCNFAVCFIAPYMLTSIKNYGHWCVGNAVINLLCTIFCYFYLIETQGLESTDIYKL